MPASLDEFLAYELNWEPAAQQLLKDAGQPVKSPFFFQSASSGEGVNQQSAPDDGCFVSYEPGNTTDEILSWFANAGMAGGIATLNGGFQGTLVVTRRVPVSDAPAKPGAHPACYVALLKELGIIRRVLLDGYRPFEALLPLYDILSITEAAPNRHLDGPRMANQATLRFPVRWTPAEGALEGGEGT